MSGYELCFVLIAAACEVVVLELQTLYWLVIHLVHFSHNFVVYVILYFISKKGASVSFTQSN